jgi:thimet oligopeptidase
VQVTYGTVIEPLARLEGDQYHTLQSVTFPSHVSTRKAIREAATAAETKLNAYAVKSSMRLDVYQRAKAFSLKGEKLESEEQRYVDRLVRLQSLHSVQLFLGCPL